MSEKRGDIRMDAAERTNCGRERDSSIDVRLVQAAARIIEEEGFAKATVEAVVRAAETSKSAFYRRYASVVDLIPAIVQLKNSDGPLADSGSLDGDLWAFEKRQAGFFADVLVQRCMNAWLMYLSDHPGETATFSELFLDERRDSLEKIVLRAARRGEIFGLTEQMPREISELLIEVLMGPFFLRLLEPGLGQLNELEIGRTVRIASATVRHALAYPYSMSGKDVAEPGAWAGRAPAVDGSHAMPSRWAANR
ncbi:MAG: TetR/AcrR family transcriptional regulator [Ancrocorticia sp.]|nr:TetR/AcrR family transcriptional regulator [Ancrocorticia sp.]